MDKFLGKVTGGISLCEAVEDRYGAVEGETAGIILIHFNYSRKKP